MVILPQKGETFDDLLTSFHKNALIKLTKDLIQLDNKIYISRDQNRFTFIKKVSKKIISSVGMFDYTRRYYFDNLTKEHIFLLDNQIGIGKNSSITNELRLKILRYAAKMSYREVGEKVCPNYVFSKATIYRIIKDTQVNLSLIHI